MPRNKDNDRRHKAVPTSRVGRFARMARMASGVAGGMLAEGSRQLRDGKRLNARDMLLTPANARRVADQLATMRGAAMKVGQMLSMDTGDFLPRELADILARLRDDARFMPVDQLCDVMEDAFGTDWESMFYNFDMQPIAAASIGQVHRTLSPEGYDIVLKIQYPGVADSIDSDVNNITGLLRLSGLIPDDVDIQPLLDDAKAQLKDEADYLLEAEYLEAFGDLLADDERFIVPTLVPEYTHENILAMTYVSGDPIDTVAKLPQEDRDAVMTALIELVLRELFELRLMQTDPNFANYRYRPEDGRIVLLDFGATRKYTAAFSNGFKRLAKAAIAGNPTRMIKAAEALGYSVGEEDSEYREMILQAFELALEPLCEDVPYDFATSTIAQEFAEMGESMMAYREVMQPPPIQAVFFQRKLGGMFMLATRLKARVNVHQLIAPFLKG